MRHLIVVIAIISYFAVMSPAANACSCGGSGAPCESYGLATAVFVGTAVSVREVEKPKPGNRDDWFFPRAYKFSVEQSYLGVPGTEIEIRTGYGGGDCGFNFKIGERYLVYVGVYNNQLITSICSRTKTFASASEDLAFLGTLSSAAPGATIHGRIAYGRMAKTEAPPLPSDVAVIIEGGNVRREIRPDAEGRYRVAGLPAGKFKVTAKLPETLTTYQPERELSVADRGCADVSYYISDNGRVSGRVIDAEGQPIAKISVVLFDPVADPKKGEAKFDRTDDEGRFKFTSVQRGEYLIGVNQLGYRDPNDPSLAYPPVFYPRVVDQPNAETVKVGAGEKLTDLEIRVPLRRPVSVLRIEAVWADGSPVENAWLTLKDVSDGQPDSGHGHKADEQGRFTIDGYIGQKLMLEARSNRPYVPLGNRYEAMERCEPVRVTLSKSRETVKIVITKIR